MPRLSQHPAYPWIVTAAAAIAFGAGFGAISTISVLVAPLEGEFGWARADISLAYTLMALGVAFGGVGAGRLADRLPAGPIVATGVAVLGAGLVLVAFQTSLATMQITFLALGLLGFSCLYAPILSTVTMWFPRRSGMALGVVTAGGAIGQAGMPVLFQSLVDAGGWRAACVTLGIAYLVVLLPVAAMVRKPETPRAAAAGAEETRAAIPPAVSMTLVCVAAFFCCALMGVPVMHLVPLATESGYGGEAAARLAGLMMLASIAGRIGAGPLCDRFGALRTYALLGALQTASVALFVMVESLTALSLVAVAYGVALGGAMTSMVCVSRDAVPRSSVATSMALVGMMAWIGMGAGGYQAGLCFDRTDSYDLSFINAALGGIGNLAALGLLGVLMQAGRAGRASTLSRLLAACRPTLRLPATPVACTATAAPHAR